MQDRVALDLTRSRSLVLTVLTLNLNETPATHSAQIIVSLISLHTTIVGLWVSQTRREKVIPLT